MKFKKHWLPPVIFGGAVLSLSLTVLTIGARSPFTHANLDSKPTGDYNRTVQTLIGPAQPLQAHAVSGNSSGAVGGGSAPAVNTGGAMTAPHGDLTQQGQALFFGLDCASCHGLQGAGGVFAPIIQGVSVTDIQTNTSAGPGGMPKFAGLTDQDVQALAAYLKSVVPGSSGTATQSATTGTAAPAAATTDVVALKQTPASLATDDAAWSAAQVTTVHTDVIPESKATGPVDVKMQALYSATDVWFRFQWSDPTQDAFNVWQWDGTKWTSPSTTSDRLSLYWEIQPVADFEARGCQALCHKGAGDPISKWYMIAPNPTDELDNWQWTASTFAAMGGANNLHITGVNIGDPTSSSYRGSAIVADPNTGGGTVSNTNATKDGPTMMQDPTKQPLYGPGYLAVSEAVALDVSKLKVGAQVPKSELAPFQGERGDIDGKTSYANGQYTVVFHRKLDTGFPDDAKFTVGGTFTFGLAVWNSLDQENHTVTGQAYHLKLQ
ncbi:MAG TPA: ethylbenzene dehydrogenase-related protein [Tepidiformaceae bacterium]